MNGFIPALIAVLLAEVGPRGAALTLPAGRLAIVFVVAAVLAASAVGGGLIAPLLAPNAEELLIALALAFGAWAQVGRLSFVTTARAALFGFWRGGTSFLVFALATRFGPGSVGAGAALGLGMAALLGVVLRDNPGGMRVLRGACASILLVAAAILAAVALRLV